MRARSKGVKSGQSWFSVNPTKRLPSPNFSGRPPIDVTRHCRILSGPIRDWVHSIVAVGLLGISEAALLMVGADNFEFSG